MENIDAQSLIGEDARTVSATTSLSGVAASLARGVCRYFSAAGFGCLLETPLRSGRRADVMALGPKGEIVIVEIKSGPQDYRTDKKWRDYAEFCDRFYFAVGRDFPQALIPQETGLILADRYGAAAIRDGPSHPLAGARRKAVTLRFARLSALRLQAVSDPEAMKVL
ncbi:MmcB family DNA repair protein [Chenggangzhangella methanolivorans]|uniref:MmcB family DNA repair protein n=1 Tax=Chenggangzhangella methanolivorans TaxID=1437009 RepID=A0A9E6UMN6_9HYPH|nr:MmcB family DNA repair protein [Chenggangzhangella methanolivorans]QZO01907.1 MmcB family DNA repair protein [Chenggangzhangella methanolivorans]